MKISKEDWLSRPHYEYPFRKMKPNTTEAVVEHPVHYNKGNIETIDVIEDWNLDFHCGNAVKYIARHKHKNKPRQDIEKAIWYLQRYLEKM
jgi:hypothetical protein